MKKQKKPKSEGDEFLSCEGLEGAENYLYQLDLPDKEKQKS